MDGLSFPRQDSQSDPQAEQKQNVRDVATQYSAFVITDIRTPMMFWLFLMFLILINDSEWIHDRCKS